MNEMLGLTLDKILCGNYKSSIEIYTDLGNIYNTISKKHDLKSKLYGSYGVSRGVNRVKSLEKNILNQSEIKPTSYLDIGCLDGNITSAVGSHFELHKNQIHGIDIEDWSISSGFTFSKYDGKKLPFSDGSFDLITCFMTLHHIPEENMDILMEEINRVTKINGIVIIREHNTSEKIDHTSLDIMHNFYDFVWDNKKWNDELEKGNYNNSEWTDLFKKYGFSLGVKPKIWVDKDKNPFMSYFCSYKKEKNIKQPYVIHYDEKLVANLQSYGLVPDVELNEDTFNKFVLPRYEQFIYMGYIVE